MKLPAAGQIAPSAFAALPSSLQSSPHLAASACFSVPAGDERTTVQLQRHLMELQGTGLALQHTSNSCISCSAAASSAMRCCLMISRRRACRIRHTISVNAVPTVSNNPHLCHACVQRGRTQRCSSLIAMQRKAAQAWCFSHQSLQVAMAQTGYDSSSSWRRHELAAVRIMLHL